MIPVETMVAGMVARARYFHNRRELARCDRCTVANCGPKREIVLGVRESACRLVEVESEMSEKFGWIEGVESNWVWREDEEVEEP